MHHDTPLISMIVAGLVLAYIFGMIANRFRLPPLVGYLFAGVLVGPFTPGFVADQGLANELAEIGVVLLMFGVGLHFSLKDLMSVRALAIPGALAQIVLATLLGLGLALLLGWGLGAGLIFGLALSVASTVVLLKALQDKRLVETERGRIAVGWLIVEDMAMVLALVLIPAFAGLAGGAVEVHDPFVNFVERVIGTPVGLWGVLGLTIVKMAAFVGFMLVVGRRVIPWMLHLTAHTGSRELFRLAVLAIALGVALGSAVLFGVSLALGAFFAGMILSESELSHRAAQETLPLRDAFAVLFFVSVGMLFDPSIVVTQPLPVLATVFIIIVGKSIVAFAIVRMFGRSVSTALTISASLAQIGEFSFILASLGVSLAILPPEGQDLILAGALISIVLNPLVFFALDLAKPMLEARAGIKPGKSEAEPVRVEPGEAPVVADAVVAANTEDGVEPTKLVEHTILVGFGRVGSVVGQGLHQTSAPLCVIEDSDSSIAAARALGIEVIVGNAASVEVLALANIARAKCLLIAIPNAFEAGQVTEQGRKLSPALRIIARAHSDEEEAHLRHLGADTVIMGEREIGLGMLAWLKGERDGAAAAPGPKLAPVDNVIIAAAGASLAVEPELVPVIIEPILPAPTPPDVIIMPDESTTEVTEPPTYGLDVVKTVDVEPAEAASGEVEKSSAVVTPEPALTDAPAQELPVEIAAEVELDTLEGDKSVVPSPPELPDIIVLPPPESQPTPDADADAEEPTNVIPDVVPERKD